MQARASRFPEANQERERIERSEEIQPAQANDKEKRKTQKQKGDISNEVGEGTFLTSFDTYVDLNLTREGGRRMVFAQRQS